MAKAPKDSETNVRRHVDVALYLLRHRMTESEFRHVDIQDRLGWGKSYISQLINGNKSLRVNHVLLILGCLDESPAEFWKEVFSEQSYRRMDADKRERLRRVRRANPPQCVSRETKNMLVEIRALKRQTRALCSVLLEKDLFTLQDLEDACRNPQSG